MTTSEQTLRGMDDSHLIATLRADLDPTTCTAAEAVLLDRFEDLIIHIQQLTTAIEAMTSPTTPAMSSPALAN